MVVDVIFGTPTATAVAAPSAKPALEASTVTETTSLPASSGVSGTTRWWRRESGAPLRSHW